MLIKTKITLFKQLIHYLTMNKKDSIINIPFQDKKHLLSCNYNFCVICNNIIDNNNLS